MSKRVLLVLSDGFEDIEAVTPVDLLTRAGVEVVIAGLKAGPVRGAYGTTILSHTTFDEVRGEIFDGIVLPGGSENAAHLAADSAVINLVRQYYREGRLVAAICAAPGAVLAEAAGILKDRRATGYPGFNDKLEAAGAIVTDESVTADGHVITGMGPGAAMLFSLQLVEYLVDKQTADGFARNWRFTR